MKVIVKEVFCDKFTGSQYNVGEELILSDVDRVNDLEARGLVEVIEKEEAPAKVTKRKKGDK